MSEQAYNVCLFLYALAYLPFMDQHSPAINGGLGLLAMVGWGMRRTKKHFPSWLRGVVVLLGVFLIYLQYGTLRGMTTGVGILAFLGLLKTTEMSSKRDFMVFLLILELLLVGHLLSEDSLAMLLYVLAVSFLLFAALLIFHQNENLRQFDRYKIKIYGKIFAFSVFLAVGLFFLFPRLQVGNIFANNTAPVAQMGFSEEIKPGDFARITSNTSPIFRVRFTSKNPPPLPLLYWRGTVLGKVENFHWKKGSLGAVREKRATSKGIKHSFEVDFASLQDGPLFLLEGAGRPRPLGRGRLKREAGETYRFELHLNQKVRYQGVVFNDYHYSLSEVERRKYLQLPEQKSQRVEDYVRNLMNIHKTEGQRVVALMNSFSGGKFRYTLNPGTLTGNQLEQFLFESKRGYCEHFASATAVLLRMMGIPARLVVGLHGGLYNPFGEYYLLRGQDAHAWVEYWSEGGRWRRLDPVKFVAPDRIRLGSDAFLGGQVVVKRNQENTVAWSWWRNFRLATDMIYYEVNRKFAGLDYQTQKNFLAKWGGGRKNSFEVVSGGGGTSGHVCGASFGNESLFREGEKSFGTKFSPSVSPLGKKGVSSASRRRPL